MDFFDASKKVLIMLIRDLTTLDKKLLIKSLSLFYFLNKKSALKNSLMGGGLVRKPSLQHSPQDTQCVTAKMGIQ